MKYITTNQLLEKFKHKEMLELSDLVQVIKDEFDVNVWIEEENEDSILEENLSVYNYLLLSGGFIVPRCN